MAQVTVSWQLNSPVNSNLTPGNTQVSITGGALTAPLSMSVSGSPAVFPSVDPDLATQPYTATVQLLDNSATPVPIGTPISAQFSVANPAPVVNTPSDLTITVV
jgi:hypothetical protein